MRVLKWRMPSTLLLWSTMLRTCSMQAMQRMMMS